MTLREKNSENNNNYSWEPFDIQLANPRSNVDFPYL